MHNNTLMSFIVSNCDPHISIIVNTIKTEHICGEGNIHAAVTDQIEVFSINGDKITEYGNGVLGHAGEVAFLDYYSSSRCPYSFVTDHVVEGKVHVFDWSEDKLIHSVPMGKRPLGLTVDQEGTIVVGDWNDKKFHRF